MMIDAKINQAESEQFRIGQTATIRLDAFEGKTFPGKVFSIGALAISSGRQNFFIRSVPIRVAFETTRGSAVYTPSTSEQISQ